MSETEFSYTAADKIGTLQRGTLAAADKQDLIVKLQAQGLFLVTNLPMAQTPPETVERVSPPKSRRMGAMLLLALMAWGLQTAHRHRPSMDTRLLNEKLAQLHRNMTRDDVEKIIGSPSPGSLNPHKIWYAVPPQFILEVTYQARGTDAPPINKPRLLMIKLLLSPKPF